MIIWLASYPKSGNTWVRSFLNSLFFTKDGAPDINNLKIGQFPERRFFNNLVKDVHDLKELSKNWIMAQNVMNLDGKKKFLKTHNTFCKIDGNYFTDNKNTTAVIYIVRDPRNVVTSIMHHYEKKDYQEALDFLLDENRIIGGNKYKMFNRIDDGILTLIGSWKSNYISWKKFSKNLYLIKYENLLKNPENEFIKLSDFLSELLNIKIDVTRIKKSVISNDFNSLKSLEQKNGFVESAFSHKMGKKKSSFFNLGPKNNWQKLINENIKTQIEKNFNNEMKELGYL